MNREEAIKYMAEKPGVNKVFSPNSGQILFYDCQGVLCVNEGGSGYLGYADGYEIYEPKPKLLSDESWAHCMQSAERFSIINVYLGICQRIRDIVKEEMGK